MKDKKTQKNAHLTLEVTENLDPLREKHGRSYSEVIKQLLIDTGNWKIRRK
jgi:hypothetical protein